MPAIYDAVLSLSEEVDLIWRRKFSLASAIFALNRLGLVSMIIYPFFQATENVRATVSNPSSANIRTMIGVRHNVMLPVQC